jgi:hypothetical protein
MVEPGHRLAIGQLQPALGALQGLDVRFLVDRKYKGVFRWLQVQRDNVGGLLREGRIGADAPAAPPRQRDLVPAQNPPDLEFGNVAQISAAGCRPSVRNPAAAADPTPPGSVSHGCSRNALACRCAARP